MGTITFEHPPLTEVSFGFKFEPLAAFRASHFGLFWSRLRPDFNEAVDKAVIASEGAVPAVPGSEWFPLPRVWYVHKEKEQLLQLQIDRFYLNWRRTQPSTEYPRFTTLEPLFHKYLTEFQNFLSEEGLGAPNVQVAELTYVNQIEEGACWQGMHQIGRVFPDLTWRDRASQHGGPEGFAWSGKFLAEDVELNANIKTQTPPDAPRRFLLELRATSRKKVASSNSLLAWYPIANETIVSAFVDLTSPELQANVWKRTDNERRH